MANDAECSAFDLSTLCLKCSIYNNIETKYIVIKLKPNVYIIKWCGTQGRLLPCL